MNDMHSPKAAASIIEYNRPVKKPMRCSHLRVSTREEVQAVLMWNCTPNDNGCWIWNVSKSQTYGIACVNGVHMKAHRASYWAFIGDIPEGSLACHKCDVPKCINPNHLFIGTHTDNMRDMTKKGRGFSMPGEKNPKAKLTPEDILAIIAEYKRGEITLNSLGKKYQVSGTTISGIISGKDWRCFNSPQRKILQDSVLNDPRKPNTKLNKEQALELIRLCRAGNLSQTEIGKIFGVSQATVSAIFLGSRWKGIECEQHF